METIAERTEHNMRAGIDPAPSHAKIHPVDRPMPVRIVQRRTGKPARILAAIGAAELDAGRMVREVQGETLHLRGGEGGGEGVGCGGEVWGL